MDELLEKARALSLGRHGRRVGFFVPGMFIYDGRRGRYPALSLTGRSCALSCLHCRGRLLETMTPAQTPESLLSAARRAAASGSLGLLVSGGCDAEGRLPWSAFVDALARIKEETHLVLSVHAGFADGTQARELKKAGVDLALIDVIGGEETLSEIYGLSGPGRVAESLAALKEAGLAIVPHVVVGLHHGRLKGEERAVEMIASAGIDRIVFVVFMPLKGTPLAGASPPEPEEVASLMARTRLSHPEMEQHLGCAKPRGEYHRRLDRLALLAGVNHIAIPAPEAVDLAAELGLETFWAETCCALGASVEELINVKEIVING